MKSFKKFVENYEPVNEAEYNKEWWDSKSDSFKKRYIERHPNSIYAKNHTGLKGVEKNREKSKSTSISALSDLLKDKNSTSKDFETAATVLLDKPQNEEPWMRKVIALAKHPYTPKSVIQRMEKEQPFVALHSPKASQAFLDAEVKALDPMLDYTWVDVLVQNPALDKSQRKIAATKLEKAIKDVDKLKKDVYGSPIIDSQKDYMRKRFQWQLDQLKK